MYMDNINHKPQAVVVVAVDITIHQALALYHKLLRRCMVRMKFQCLSNSLNRLPNLNRAMDRVNDISNKIRGRLHHFK
jgi:hypothetical protein